MDRGLDPDIGTTNQLLQYNYLHDNQDGILLCGCNGSVNFGSAIVRYNVVTGSWRWNLHVAQVAGTPPSTTRHRSSSNRRITVRTTPRQQQFAGQPTL